MVEIREKELLLEAQDFHHRGSRDDVRNGARGGCVARGQMAQAYVSHTALPSLGGKHADTARTALAFRRHTILIRGQDGDKVGLACRYQLMLYKRGLWWVGY
jgi:hypothetical protein